VVDEGFHTLETRLLVTDMGTGLHWRKYSIGVTAPETWYPTGIAADFDARCILSRTVADGRAASGTPIPDLDHPPEK
jgi:hypothetical protein